MWVDSYIEHVGLITVRGLGQITNITEIDNGSLCRAGRDGARRHGPHSTDKEEGLSLFESNKSLCTVVRETTYCTYTSISSRVTVTINTETDLATHDVVSILVSSVMLIETGL